MDFPSRTSLLRVPFEPQGRYEEMHTLDNAFHSKENESDKKLLQDEGYEIYSGGGLLLIEAANTSGTIYINEVLAG